MHPRTRQMLESALRHARAQFTACGCATYEGSAWNEGTHLTVIIDRCVCPEHASCASKVDVWVYDISGASPKYLGRDDVPENVALLKEPGDRGLSAKTRSSLKN